MLVPVLSVAGVAATACVTRLALSKYQHQRIFEAKYKYDDPPTLDLSAWNADTPSAFYLTLSLPASLSDCFATVDGLQLPLHSGVISSQSAALASQLTQVHKQRYCCSQARPDLSAGFEGSTLPEATCLLRLLYRPHEAHRASFAELAQAGLLEGVARLAHSLQAARLLRCITAYLQDVSNRQAVEQAGVTQLATALRAAQACRSTHASSGCLEAMAEKLATGGASWRDGGAENALTGLDSATLARLVRKTSEAAVRGLYRRTPPVFDVRSSGDGRAGGFTFAIPRFSSAKTSRCLLSPWTEVAGFMWRLRVHPAGSGSGKGTHLSVFVQWDHTRALSAGYQAVTAAYTFTVIDQGPSGRDCVTLFNGGHSPHASGSSGGGANSSAGGGRTGSAGTGSAAPLPGVFSRHVDTWGRHQLVPLEQLRCADRDYLRGDRLLLRLDVRVIAAEAA